MPGMDGLQAVQAIKSNPQTAMIPIMMYTSQEGELYVGQARALGAMGVLPKQVRPVDVSKVLYELHLLPDRRDMNQPALLPVELENGAAVERAPPPAGSNSQLSDWGRRIEAAVKQQSVDLRRFTVASLDSFAARMTADLRAALMPPTSERSGTVAAARLEAAAAMGVAGGARRRVRDRRTCARFLWVTTREDLTKLRAELASLHATNADLQRARADLTAAGEGSDRRARGDDGADGRPEHRPRRRDCSAPNRSRMAKYRSIAAVSMCCAICCRSSRRRAFAEWSRLRAYRDCFVSAAMRSTASRRPARICPPANAISSAIPSRNPCPASNASRWLLPTWSPASVSARPGRSRLPSRMPAPRMPRPRIRRATSCSPPGNGIARPRRITASSLPSRVAPA